MPDIRNLIARFNGLAPHMAMPFTDTQISIVLSTWNTWLHTPADVKG